MSDDSIQLHGIIPPVITPLNDDGTFDAPSARRLYKFHIDAGVNGLFLFGSSGEGPHLSAADQETAVKTAVEVSNGRVPVLAGLMEAGTDRCITAGLRWKELGADVVVVAPPFYFPASQADVETHFRSIRSAVGLPVMAYDIPQTTKIKIELETMLSLAADGTVVGVKDSSPFMVQFRRLLLKRPTNFSVLTGAELLIDMVLHAGANGSVPGLSNVAPELFVKLYSQFQAGEFKAVRQTQESIVRLFDVFADPATGQVNASYAIRSMKSAMKLRGVIDSCRTLAPIPPVSDEQLKHVESSLREAGLL